MRQESLAALLLTGCGSLASIPHRPAQTPDSRLRIQPCVEFPPGARPIVLVQPSTTAIAYLLGAVALGAGLHFLRTRDGQRARLWWGTALLLWGAGALAAGTRCEAFSWHVNCAGRTTCSWTSRWEIWSLVLLLVGSLPSAVLGVVLNASRYRTMKRALDLALLRARAWMALTIGAYYLYLVSGGTQQPWARGAWFSENDTLHVGLIPWMAYIVRGVAPHGVDETEPGC